MSNNHLFLTQAFTFPMIPSVLIGWIQDPDDELKKCISNSRAIIAAMKLNVYLPENLTCVKAWAVMTDSLQAKSLSL